MSLDVREVTDSFFDFAKIAQRVMHIGNEAGYYDALMLVEHLMLTLDSISTDPLADLLNIISNAIEVYENEQPDIKQFVSEYEKMDKGVAVLKVLMEQYGLGVADFKEEIGNKSYVSMILSGERQLSKKHIEKLCLRFNISPELFF